MLFLTDTIWPAGLRTIFDICHQAFQPLENRYSGPYNKLFTYCFGPDSFDFFVVPQVPPSELASRDTAVCLLVFDARCRPVLVAEIMDDAWANKADLRLKADEKMRQRYNAMFTDCLLPRLYGLSLLGTSLRVYVADIATGEIEPTYTDCPSPSRLLPRDFLEGVWNIDILSQEGFNKMKEIVEDIICNAAALEKAQSSVNQI